MDRQQVAEAVGRELGVPVQAVDRLSGGDVHQAWALTLDRGRRLFAKTLATIDDEGDTAPGGGTIAGVGGTRVVTRAEAHRRFRTEARDLAWLAETGTVAIPAVVAVGPVNEPFLALDWIGDGVTSGLGPHHERLGQLGTEERFGVLLARLHQYPADVGRRESFGRSDGLPTGSRRLPNEPGDDWTEFYRTRRLEPLAELASATSALPPAILARLTSVALHLDRWIPPEVEPARLHGDLWGGNRMVDRAGTSWLIDPACFVGDREFDLAMMRLFGGFGAGCYTAYQDQSPLTDGWRERIDLYQLTPLVVHAIKFAGPYPRAVEAALDRLLGPR